MSFILSAKTVELPDTFDEDEIPLNIKVREIPDVIIYGRITECITDNAILGAVVKAFLLDDDGDIERDLCHTFSGCDGYYMLRLPPDFEGRNIRIMATADNCPIRPELCDCETQTETLDA